MCDNPREEKVWGLSRQRTDRAEQWNVGWRGMGSWGHAESMVV